MAETTLDDSLKKFLAGPETATTPVSPLGYDPSQTVAPTTSIPSFRPSVSDVINVSNMAGGKGYTEPELWAKELAEKELAQKVLEQNRAHEQAVLEQNRQYELSKKEADMRNQLAQLQLQDYMRSRASSGGGGVRKPTSGFWKGNMPRGHYLPSNLKQSNPRAYYALKSGGKQGSNIIYAPPGLSGGALGNWAHDQQMRAMRENRTPPDLRQRYSDLPQPGSQPFRYY